MDESTRFFVFGIFILLWRELQLCAGPVLHKFCQRGRDDGRSCTGPFLQWYTFGAAFLGWFFVRTVIDVVEYDCIGLHFLRGDVVHANLVKLLEESSHELDVKHELEQLDMNGWLKTASLIGSAVGALAFALSMWTSKHSIQLGKQCRLFGTLDEPGRKDDANEWRLERNHDYVILVISVPAIFALMSIRAEIRIWALMAGTAGHLREPCNEEAAPDFQHVFKSMANLGRVLTTSFYNRRGQGCGYTWPQIKDLESWTARTDMILAEMSQYLAVWAFVMLCHHYTDRAKKLHDQDLRETLDIDHAEYSRRNRQTGRRLRFDVTKQIQAALREHGAYNLTGGRTLMQLLPKTATGEMFNTLTLCSGRHAHTYNERCKGFLWLRRRFNVSELQTEVVYSYALFYPGLIGVWAYLVMGLIGSGLDLWFAFAAETDRQSISTDTHDEILAEFNDIFVFSTILCIVNMGLVISIQDITDRAALGSTAGLKFFASRLLIMIAPLQQKFFSLFRCTAGLTCSCIAGAQCCSKMQVQACSLESDKHLFPASLQGPLQSILDLMKVRLSEQQAQLWHASLLSWWCLCCAIFNCIFWYRWPRPFESLDEEDPNTLTRHPLRSKRTQVVAACVEDDQDGEGSPYAPLLDAHPISNPSSACSTWETQSFRQHAPCEACGKYLQGSKNGTNGMRCSYCKMIICQVCARSRRRVCPLLADHPQPYSSSSSAIIRNFQQKSQPVPPDEFFTRSVSA